MDIAHLLKFYANPLGKIAQEELTQLTDVWIKNVNSRSLFIGFPFPLVPRDSDSYLYLMDRHIGATLYPLRTKNKVALIDLEFIPLPDESVPHIVIIHCLEFASSPAKFMREVWRVLQPEGLVHIIAPNRRSIWSHLDSSPFGHGNPYSMSQLSDLVKTSQFDIIEKKRGLFTLPHQSWQPSIITTAQHYLIKTFVPKLSGVIAMELKKRVYCKALPKERKRLATPTSAIRARVSSFEDRG